MDQDIAVSPGLLSFWLESLSCAMYLAKHLIFNGILSFAEITFEIYIYYRLMLIHELNTSSVFTESAKPRQTH